MSAKLRNMIVGDTDEGGGRGEFGRVFSQESAFFLTGPQAMAIEIWLFEDAFYESDW